MPRRRRSSFAGAADALDAFRQAGAGRPRGAPGPPPVAPFDDDDLVVTSARLLLGYSRGDGWNDTSLAIRLPWDDASRIGFFLYVDRIPKYYLFSDHGGG
jgi:hypothetical protein